MKYLLPFLISFFITVIFILAGIALGKKISWKGRNSFRHAHDRRSFRLGGIALALAFFGTVFLDKNLVATTSLYGVMAASVVLLLIGVWDDLREISWKFQLAGQVLAGIIVFSLGVRVYYISNPLTGGIIHFDSPIKVIFSAIFVVLWIIFMMNSMNWLDGIDGLSGGVSFIGAITIFVLSLKPEVNQPPMAILSVIFAGATLGFLVFNFYPSRIMAGTSGATFMGFILAVMAIFAGTKIATSILVLSLPGMDFMRVVWERWRNSSSLFEPDDRHLHYALIRYGWSPRKIGLCVYSVTLLLAIVALNTKIIGKSVALVTVFVVMVIFLFIISKKDHD